MSADGDSSVTPQQRTALSSVAAAGFLVVLKLGAGLASGSLGLLAEAAHSATDFGSAVLTFFAIRVSDRPADSSHTYGHRKAEHLAALAEGAAFGRGKLPAPQKINVEYVSANPTGPMHVGHGRGAVFGDALSSLLDFAGFEVTREYYINDAGAQVDVLARSAFMRYREALGQAIGEIPEGLYPGDYLKPVGAALAARFGESLLGKPEGDWLEDVRMAAIDAMMDMIREDLAALNIRHAVFFSERSLTRGGQGGGAGRAGQGRRPARQGHHAHPG
jgi:hypothetical protein